MVYSIICLVLRFYPSDVVENGAKFFTHLFFPSQFWAVKKIFTLKNFLLCIQSPVLQNRWRDVQFWQNRYRKLWRTRWLQDGRHLSSECEQSCHHYLSDHLNVLVKSISLINKETILSFFISNEKNSNIILKSIAKPIIFIQLKP